MLLLKLLDSIFCFRPKDPINRDAEASTDESVLQCTDVRTL
jgi:hypothetical protein